MRIGRIATCSFFGALAAINGPLGLYRAAMGRVTPYRGHGPTYWILTAAVNVIVGVVGIWLVVRANTRERRRKAGQCVRCWYDLRATPCICPECGAAGARRP